MISKTTKRFRQALSALPAEVRRRATSAYKQFLADPKHRSLQFKKVHTSKPVYSARKSKNHRAVGIVDSNTIIWFWIGNHADYEELLKRV